MRTVRIVKPWPKPDLLRQTPGGLGVWGDYRFTLDPISDPDYLVVFNHLPYDVQVTVSPDRVWLVIQEPPEPEYKWMHKGFRHFARVYTQGARVDEPHLRLCHGALPWHVGRTYDELAGAAWPQKSKALSWITSNLGIHPGHQRRLKFLQRLQSEVKFDLFGRGFCPIPDKWDGLAPYRYSIAVENHSCPHYWTEKVADCFLAGAMPLYHGAANLADYFPVESFVWIDLADPRTPRWIDEILKSDLAEKNRDAIAEARRRVLEEHQFFPWFVAQAASEPASIRAPRRMFLPCLPDLSQFYRDHRVLARIWYRLVNRTRHWISHS